jgi:hypothetical protein
MRWPSLLLALALSLLASQLSAQVVSPLQSGAYLPTFSGVRDMAAPSPGLAVLWYNYFAFTDTYVDRNGNKYQSIPLQGLNPGLPDVNLEVDLSSIATVPGLFWASPFTFLGGARYSATLTPVFLWADASFVTEQGRGVIDTTFRDVTNARLSGFGDLFFSPLGISWAWNHFDLTLNYGVTAPTGRYATGADDNIGIGFWVNQFQAFGYYYPWAERGTALMLAGTYEATGKIRDADLNPGNRFSLEWGISQYLSPRFELSVQGGHNWQITEDSGSDVFYDPSFRDRKSTLAFMAGYWPWEGRLNVSLKYAFDFGIRQRFQTQFFMLNLIFVTNVLGEKNTGS